MPHLHLSLQAGDDMILKRMKRRHSRADADPLLRSGAALAARRRVRRRPDRRLPDRDRGDVREHAVARRGMRPDLPACLSVLAARRHARRAHAAGAGAVVKGARRAAARRRASARCRAGSSAEVGASAVVLVEQPGFGRTEHFAPVTFDGGAPGDIVSRGSQHRRQARCRARDAGSGADGGRTKELSRPPLRRRRQPGHRDEAAAPRRRRRSARGERLRSSAPTRRSSRRRPPRLRRPLAATGSEELVGAAEVGPVALLAIAHYRHRRPLHQAQARRATLDELEDLLHPAPISASTTAGAHRRGAGARAPRQGDRARARCAPCSPAKSRSFSRRSRSRLTIDAEHKPVRHPDGRRQRHRQDHDDRQARGALPRRRQAA